MNQRAPHTANTNLDTARSLSINQMDRFDLSELAAVSYQPLLFGTYPHPSTIKRHQTYLPAFTAPVYNSIEDWSAAELVSDSAPSPAVNSSPISPVIPDFSLPNSGEDWTSWEKVAESPESDFVVKSELPSSPDLTVLPFMSPNLESFEETTLGMDDVAFGSEGVNDTRPLFQQAQTNPNIPGQGQGPLTSSGPPTPSQPSSTQAQRYPARNSLKRKSSNCSSRLSSRQSSCSPPPPQRRHNNHNNNNTSTFSKNESGSKPTVGPKKTAHNMIEKRYRTNLNEKIAALRDSVPSLRIMVHRLEHADNKGGDAMEEIKPEGAAGVEVDDDDLTGLAPAHKLNKATILSKATEYIAHLEKKNGALVKENAALRHRVDGYEMLILGQSGQRSMWS